MTPLYYDKSRGGLTSRNGKLLECCCCNYCCDKFATGGSANPTILNTEIGDNQTIVDGNGYLMYGFEDPSCPYPERSPTVSSGYYLSITVTNNEITDITLILYCNSFYDPETLFISRAFTLTLSDPNDITLDTCGTNLFLQGTTVLSGGPCDHSYNAIFSCLDNEGKVELWRA